MESKVKVWIARDEDSRLFVYSGIPTKMITYWRCATDYDSWELDRAKFPSVKWEDDEPTEAYITLARTQEQPKQEQLTPKQEIDWEQRRYEIAKEMMPVLYRQGTEAMKYGLRFRKEIVDDAVNFADILIEKLKKEGKK